MKQLPLLLFALLMAGCEVLEEDLSGKRVPVIAPAGGVTVPPGRVDFRWSAVEHAAGYELTVVAPSFAAAGRVLVDTVIWADTLAHRFGCPLILAEGTYEWCLRGFNSGYKTRVELRSLTVLPAEIPRDPASSESSDAPES